MTILTNLIGNKIRDSVDSIDGKTLSRPILNVGDGNNVTYGIDVDIADGKILRNVPIAPGNNSMLYAEAGSAVTLSRSKTGRIEITGFSKRLPGKYKRVPVTMPVFDFGIPTYEDDPEIDESYVSRPLTLEELSTLGEAFGLTPLGAIAVFFGGVLQEIKG